VSLFRGVSPLTFLSHGHDRDLLLVVAVLVLVRTGLVQTGVVIVVWCGAPSGSPGGTNTMKIVQIGEHRRA
jgi:pyruvate kinase